ncbi:unnamed protein product, partial [Allacma fusca]
MSGFQSFLFLTLLGISIAPGLAVVVNRVQVLDDDFQ